MVFKLDETLNFRLFPFFAMLGGAGFGFFLKGFDGFEILKFNEVTNFNKS